MEKRIVEEFKNKSIYSSKLLDCFDPVFVEEATKLALNLARLNIDLNPYETFDSNVNINILMKLNQLFAKIGLINEQENQYKKLQKQSIECDEMLEQLKQLKLKFEHNFSNNIDIELVRKNMEKITNELNNFDDNIRLSSIINGGGGDDHGDPKHRQQIPMNEIELNFLLDEIEKNKQLENELNTLRNELDGFDGIDADDINEQWIDNHIKSLEKQLYQLKCESLLTNNDYHHNNDSDLTN